MSLYNHKVCFKYIDINNIKKKSWIDSRQLPIFNKFTKNNFKMYKKKLRISY